MGNHVCAVVFTGDAFAVLLNHRKVNHRCGAIGKHGSIAIDRLEPILSHSKRLTV